MKIRATILFLFILFTSISFEFNCKNERRLKVVTSPYEPFVFEKDGKLDGLDIDILTRFALEKGYSLDFEMTFFQDIWKKLESGEADVALGALYLTEERKERFLPSRGYFDTGLVIVSTSTGPINTKNELKYKKIGVKKGATGEKWAMKNNTRDLPFQVISFNDTEECFAALKRGEIDALLNDYISSRLIISKNYVGEMVISSDPSGTVYLEENKLVFYFSKIKKEECLEFNEFIERLKQSGELEKLRKKWISESHISKKELYIRFLILGVFLICLISIIVFYQRRVLKRRAHFTAEKKFKELVYEAPVAVIIHREGNLLFANKEFYRMFGFKEGEFQSGFQVIKLFAEGEHQKLLSYLEARKKEKDAPLNYEVYGLKSDGTAFPVEIDVSVVNLSGQKVTTLFVKDISEKRRIFEELKKSEEKFRKVFENVSEGIFMSSKEGKPILANPALVRMLGYDSLEELLNRDIEKEGYLDPNERKHFEEIMEKEGKVENFETIWLKKDKTPIHVIESAHALRDEKGYIFAYEGTVRDITPLKRNEELLRESESYYRSLFENAHDAIMVFEPENETILDANQLCLKMYGFSREELINSSLERISKDVSKGKEKIKELFQKGKLSNFETVHFRKDGTEMALEINASLILYKGKTVVLSINRDITDKKKAEKLIAERNKQLLALLESAQAMESFTDLHLSAESICKSVVNTFSLSMAWIGLVVPESTELKVIASAGRDEGYTEKVGIRWDESERAKGPTGRCIVRRTPVIMRVDEPDFAPWREEAEKRGFKIVCAFPLIHEDTVRGALTLYSSDENSFTPFTMETLEIFSRHASMNIVTAFLFAEAERTVQELLDSAGEKEKIYNELKTKARLLEKSAEKFRNIVEKARGILLTFDTNGKITYFNEYAQDFFGFKEEEILGKSLFETIVPVKESTGRDLKSLLENIMKDPNKYASNINENITKDGRRVWIAWTNRPILDPGGKICEVLSVGTDITQLKLSHSIFEKYEKILEEIFVSGMGVIFIKDFNGNIIQTTLKEDIESNLKEKWNRVFDYINEEPSKEDFLKKIKENIGPVSRILKINVGDGEVWKLVETGRIEFFGKEKVIKGFLSRIF